jgi:hypothetical protein
MPITVYNSSTREAFRHESNLGDMRRISPLNECSGKIKKTVFERSSSDYEKKDNYERIQKICKKYVKLYQKLKNCWTMYLTIKDRERHPRQHHEGAAINMRR